MWNGNSPIYLTPRTKISAPFSNLWWGTVWHWGAFESNFTCDDMPSTKHRQLTMATNVKFPGTINKIDFPMVDHNLQYVIISGPPETTLNKSSNNTYCSTTCSAFVCDDVYLLCIAQLACLRNM